MSVPASVFPNPNPTTILIVEDNPVNVEVMKEMLNSEGFNKIFVAASGKEAIQLFSEELHLIIMDFNLPDTNGIKLTDYHRNYFPQKNTPIVCWSTDIEKIRHECIEAGVDDFLPKPHTREELLDILECWTFYREAA